jgi:hypothetical protein
MQSLGISEASPGGPTGKKWVTTAPVAACRRTLNLRDCGPTSALPLLFVWKEVAHRRKVLGNALLSYF